jgi:3,4-dihydroxy 2-butanone 4-phosphate synthase / GTP cyclohydrolase II
MGIEFKSNPFNQTYLNAKEQYGHKLKQKFHIESLNCLPFDPIKPFTPYEIPDCPRLVHCASYFLPLKPVNFRYVMK